MKKKFISLFSLVTIITLVAFAGVGCALFKPNATGDCPQVTTTGAAVIAYGGSLAALQNGAPASVLKTIANNIDDAVVTGNFSGDLINVAIANAGGAKWAAYLGGASLLFQTEFSAVNSNAAQQVCVKPVLKNISLGIRQALAMQGQPAAAKLAAYRKQ